MASFCCFFLVIAFAAETDTREQGKEKTPSGMLHGGILSWLKPTTMCETSSAAHTTTVSSQHTQENCLSISYPSLNWSAVTSQGQAVGFMPHKVAHLT